MTWSGWHGVGKQLPELVRVLGALKNIAQLVLKTSTKLKNSHNPQRHPSPLQIFLWLNCLEFYLATTKNGIGKGQKKHFQAQSSVFRLLSPNMLITAMPSELCFSGEEDDCRKLAQTCLPFALLLRYSHKTKFPHGWIGVSWGCSNSDPLPMVLLGSLAPRGWDYAGSQLGAGHLGDFCSGWHSSLLWGWVTSKPVLVWWLCCAVAHWTASSSRAPLLPVSAYEEPL